jgi:hypothetical protein
MRTGTIRVDVSTPAVALSARNHGPRQLTTVPAASSPPPARATPRARPPAETMLAAAELKRTSTPSRRQAWSMSSRQAPGSMYLVRAWASARVRVCV